MSGPQAIAAAFLFVSCVALIVQSWWLHKIRGNGVRAGFHRTAACRVGCAVVYVLVGVNAIWGQHAVASVSLSAFLVTQLTWMANGGLDARDAKARQARPVVRRVRHAARHRRPRTACRLRPATAGRTAAAVAAPVSLPDRPI